jgi:predicted acetyltransferase
MLCAFDRDAMVGTAGAFRFSLNVPGDTAQAAGITEVGVLPTHRRRGILNEMMRRQLADIKAWGEPLAILWASEGNIYQRFGYGMATQRATIDIERDRATFLDRETPPSRVRLVGRDDAVRLLPDVYRRATAGVPGCIERTEDWWRHGLRDPVHRRGGGGPLFHALLETEAGGEAFASYRVHSKWGDDGTPAGWLEVVEAVGTTPDATRATWGYLFGVDLASRIKAFRLPADHPLPLMVAEPRRLRFSLGDAIWLRVVDVEAALSARSYRGDGSVVFDLADSVCPWNEGCWGLEVVSGRAHVERTSAPADLRLGAAELGAAYLGGVELGRLVQAGRVHELTAGAAARADELFRSDRAPWCPDPF